MTWVKKFNPKNKKTLGYKALLFVVNSIAAIFSVFHNLYVWWKNLTGKKETI